MAVAAASAVVEAGMDNTALGNSEIADLVIAELVNLELVIVEAVIVESVIVAVSGDRDLVGTRTATLAGGLDE